MPNISVIVPIYKVEPYLHRCVDSILNQTYTDFELILVDDGSPDQCPIICDEYKEKDKRVIVIHQENGGISAARNAGLDWIFANSDSNWITFIDSDDCIHPQYLEILLAGVKNGADFSMCGLSFLSSDMSTNDSLIDTDRIHWELMTNTEACMGLYTQNYVLYTVVYCKLFSKELLAGQRFPEDKIFEDEFFTYRILYSARQVNKNDFPLYYNYSRPGSFTKESFSLRRLHIVECLRERVCFFEQQGEKELAQKTRLHLLGSIKYNHNMVCRYLRDKSTADKLKAEFYDLFDREKCHISFFRQFELYSFRYPVFKPIWLMVRFIRNTSQHGIKNTLTLIIKRFQS